MTATDQIVADMPVSGGVRASTQTKIQARRDLYPPSMRRVADVILARPQVVLERTITELARMSETSETSVVRFCRTLGFTGYAPMRLNMATELATETALLGRAADYGSDIGQSDSLADMVSKISNSEIVGVQETALGLDLDALQAVIDHITPARSIVLFGVAASNAGAHDLAQKLLRIGARALSFQDAHDALVPAALLGPTDVAIGFSHSGRTRETIGFLSAARAGGAFTVAVTNAENSSLGDHADTVLRTAVRETAFRSGAMASRIAQLTIVDYIFVGVARTTYEESTAALKRTRESIERLRNDR